MIGVGGCLVLLDCTRTKALLLHDPADRTFGDYDPLMVQLPCEFRTPAQSSELLQSLTNAFRHLPVMLLPFTFCSASPFVVSATSDIQDAVQLLQSALEAGS